MTDQSEVDEDPLARRRVPCVIGYLSPFRIVEAEGHAGWDCSIEQVNAGTWDYVALHEVMGGIEVGLEAPYNLVVARDGALALPPLPDLRSDQAASEFLNRCLAAILLGGVYCEALSPDCLDLGSIIDWKYVRSRRDGASPSNRFHKHVRYGKASALEAIRLHGPRTVRLVDLQNAMKAGLEILDRLPTVRGEYFLKGVTGIARRDWGPALANLWIVTEQLLSELWQRHVIEPTANEDASKARRDQLNDTRTWTAAARIELLYQKGVLDAETVGALSAARKARNDLSHRGSPPKEAEAKSAYAAVQGLLSKALPGHPLPLFDLDLSDHSISDPFAPTAPIVGKPQYWMEIPPLPGEQELERAEAKARSAHRREL